VEYAPADQRYALSPEQVTCFADPESLSYVTPVATFVLKNLEQADRPARAFREGGSVPFDVYGPHFTRGMDDNFRPRVRAKLAAEWLPAVPAPLRSCGQGARSWTSAAVAAWCALRLREHSPRQRSWVSIAMPPRSKGLKRLLGRPVSRGARGSEAVPVERLSASAPFDVVTSFDVVHDLPDPVLVLRSIRALLAPGGSYVIVEGKSADGLEPGGQEMRLKYGFSMFHCLPQSMADGGVGLGNMLTEATVRELNASRFFRLRRGVLVHGWDRPRRRGCRSDGGSQLRRWCVPSDRHPPATVGG
jgi:hypothetical protein